jgi:hypothetical protein
MPDVIPIRPPAETITLQIEVPASGVVLVVLPAHIAVEAVVAFTPTVSTPAQRDRSA